MKVNTKVFLLVFVLFTFIGFSYGKEKMLTGEDLKCGELTGEVVLNSGAVECGEELENSEINTDEKDGSFGIMSTKSGVAGEEYNNLSDSLVGYWSFDGGSLEDDSGNNHKGTVYGNVNFQEGIEGKGVRFGGVDNKGYIKVENTEKLSFKDKFSFNLWFNIKDPLGMGGWGNKKEYGRQALLSKAGDRDGISINIGGKKRTGLFSPFIKNGRCCGSVSKSLGVPKEDGVRMNEWYMLTVTHGNGRVKLYLNGELKTKMDSDKFDLNPEIKEENLYMGIGQWQWWYPLNGMLDEVRVYDKALRKSKIKDLYEEIEGPDFTLNSSIPKDGGEYNYLDNLISLVFSEKLDKSTVNTGNISLIYSKTGKEVLLKKLYSSGNKITINPGFLNTNTDYKLKISEDLKSINGNKLGDKEIVNFSTVSYEELKETIKEKMIIYKESIEESIKDKRNSNEDNTESEQTPEKDKADPVNIRNGEFGYDNTLMHIPGEGIDYKLKLSYKNKIFYNGFVGVNRNHNYNKYLTKLPNGDIRFHNGKLGIYKFSKTKDGYSRNSGLKATLIQDENGNFQINFESGKTYKFGENNKITSITDLPCETSQCETSEAGVSQGENGNQLKFKYDDEDKLQTVIDTLGRKISYSYKDNGRLEEVVDFNGNKVVLDYYKESDENGSEYDLKSATIKKGNQERTISFEYTTGKDSAKLNHNLTKLIDSKGQTYVVNEYTQNDRVKSQKYGENSVKYNYETQNGRVVKNTVTDRKGNKTQYTFDKNGNILKRKVYKQNGETVNYNYEYNDKGRVTREIFPSGKKIEYTYDKRGNLTKRKIISAESDKTQTRKYNYHDIYNTPTKIVYPNGLKTYFELDNNGNVVSVTRKSDTKTLETTYKYNSDGNLVQKTDPEGNVTKFEYQSGQVSKIIKGQGQTKTIKKLKYDDYGNPEKITDGKGNTTTLEDDGFNNLEELTTPEGIKRQYIYDKNNNLKKSSTLLEDGEKTQTKINYDILDNPVKKITKQDTNKELATQVQYDANENIKKITYPNGLVQKFEYNAHGNRIKVKNIGENQTRTIKYKYDKNQNLIARTDPKGNITTYEYDGFDRLTKITGPNGNISTYKYNSIGQPVEIIKKDNNGKVLSHKKIEYNLFGKPVKHTRLKDDEKLTTNYKYNKNQKLIQKTDQEGNTTKYKYDNLNRLKEVIGPEGNKTVNFYDKNNNLVKEKTVSSNGSTKITKYKYDKDNRLIEEVDNNGNTTTYKYNNLDQLIQKTDPEGNTTKYKYDYKGNPTQKIKYNDNNEIITKYKYDENGNLTKLIDAKGNITTYTYNDFDQLIKQTYPDGTQITYQYDQNGNIVQKKLPDKTITKQYDKLNRLTELKVNGELKEEYSYDGQGRLTKGIRHYEDENITSEFEYNQLGRLTQESINGKTTKYNYDQNGNKVQINISVMKDSAEKLG